MKDPIVELDQMLRDAEAEDETKFVLPAELFEHAEYKRVLRDVIEEFAPYVAAVNSLLTKLRTATDMDEVYAAVALFSKDSP